MEKEVIKIPKDPWSIGNRFLGLAGVIAVISLINTLAIIFGWLSPAIIYSIWISISLPILFTFGYSVFKNNPNAQIRTRKLGGLIYIVISLGAFFFYYRPQSFIHFWKLFAQFGIGFGLVFITGAVYLFLFTMLEKKGYRIRALTSFVFSFITTMVIIILTKDLTIFKTLIQLFNVLFG